MVESKATRLASPDLSCWPSNRDAEMPRPGRATEKPVKVIGWLNGLVLTYVLSQAGLSAYSGVSMTRTSMGLPGRMFLQCGCTVFCIRYDASVAVVERVSLLTTTVRPGQEHAYAASSLCCSVLVYIGRSGGLKLTRLGTPCKPCRLL